MHYRVAAERAVSETIDGEVVVLDQVAGIYFSLGGAGVDVWNVLLRGATIEGVVAHVEARYEAPREGTVADAVRALIDALRRDELLASVETEAPALSAFDGERRAWAAPVFERFTDLQSLLLLDPIHDVDEGGWPRQPA